MDVDSRKGIAIQSAAKDSLGPGQTAHVPFHGMPIIPALSVRISEQQWLKLRFLRYLL